MSRTSSKRRTRLRCRRVRWATSRRCISSARSLGRSSLAGSLTSSAGGVLFLVTLGVYLVGSGLTAATFGHGAGWVTFLYAHSIHRRYGYWRRVRGHQLGDRRDDSRALPRSSRHRHQWHVLGWRAHRHGRRVLHLEPLRRHGELAHWIPDRTGSRAVRALRATKSSRESAMAHHARSRGRGRRSDETHRADVARRELADARRVKGDRDQSAKRHRILRAGLGALSPDAASEASWAPV